MSNEASHPAVEQLRTTQAELRDALVALATIDKVMDRWRMTTISGGEAAQGTDEALGEYKRFLNAPQRERFEAAKRGEL